MEGSGSTNPLQRLGGNEQERVCGLSELSSSPPSALKKRGGAWGLGFRAASAASVCHTTLTSRSAVCVLVLAPPSEVGTGRTTALRIGRA